MSDETSNEKKYDTKANTMLILVLIFGFVIVSYSLEILSDPLFWSILFVFLFAFIFIAGVVVEVIEGEIKITRFGVHVKKIEINDLEFLSVLGKTFALPVYRKKPLFFFGIKSSDAKEVLMKINSVINKVERDGFEIIVENKNLAKEALQYLSLAIILLLSGRKVESFQGGYLYLIIYFISAFLFFISFIKLSKMKND